MSSHHEQRSRARASSSQSSGACCRTASRVPSRLRAFASLVNRSRSRSEAPIGAVMRTVVTDAGPRPRASLFVGKEGRVLQSTKSVYVVPERPLSANDVYVVGSILELSVHPVLMTLDALNDGHGSLEDGELVLKRSVAS